jgi:hypothetical protein
MPPVDRDRGRVDDMALDPVGLEQAMNPKAVEAVESAALDPG